VLSISEVLLLVRNLVFNEALVLTYTVNLVDMIQRYSLCAMLVDKYVDSCVFSTLTGCYFLFEEKVTKENFRNPRPTACGQAGGITLVIILPPLA
jgi:hypothetical protein